MSIFDEIIDDLCESGIKLVANVIPIPLFGQVVNEAMNVIENSKKKKEEENIKEFLKQLADDVNIIKKMLESKEESELVYIKDNLFPLTVGYASKEQAKEKIQYYLNGFKNYIRGITKEDIVVTYFDLLSILNLNELEQFLNIYDVNMNGGRRIGQITIGENEQMKKQKKGYYQYIQNRLCVNGLLQYVEEDGTENVTVTTFGENFAKFIRKEVDLT